MSNTMNSPHTLLGIDFGNEHIRVTKTRYDPQQPHMLNPQIVEFNGRASLRNIVLLEPDLSAAQEIGAEVFDSGLAYDMPELLRRSLSLESDPVSELGQATEYLLAHIHRTLELDQLSPEELETWRTLITVPIHSSAGTDALLEARFRQAQFPSPQAFDSAQAALTWWQRQKQLVPGLYLVVDCGASHTRVALCQAHREQDYKIKATGAGPPGGRAFDQALNEHFSKLLADSTLFSSSSRLELGYFVQEFKTLFAHSWASGQESCETLYQVPSARAIFNLNRTEFEAPTLAGELISSFRTTAYGILEKCAVNPTDLSGIVIVGGGAHWPFVGDWARQVVESDRVYQSEYPEETIVRGVTHLAVEPAPSAPPATEKKTLPSRKQTSRPRPTKKTPPAEISPSRAFWTELLGGLFGFMGMGWFFVLHNVPMGCLGLLGWWVTLSVTVVGLGISSLFTSERLPLLFIWLIWLLGPLLSASLAFWIARRRRSNVGGS